MYKNTFDRTELKKLRIFVAGIAADRARHSWRKVQSMVDEIYSA